MRLPDKALCFQGRLRGAVLYEPRPLVQTAVTSCEQVQRLLLFPRDLQPSVLLGGWTGAAAWGLPCPSPQGASLQLEDVTARDVF